MTYIMSDKKRYLMSESERTERDKIKAVHKKLREPLRGGRSGDRYDLLAWAFARGFKFRRCERSHHTQIVNGALYEHHMPDDQRICERLVRAGALLRDGELPGFYTWRSLAKTIQAWLADPTGAVAAPAPKPKKLYMPVAAE